MFHFFFTLFDLVFKLAIKFVKIQAADHHTLA